MHAFLCMLLHINRYFTGYEWLDGKLEQVKNRKRMKNKNETF